MQKPKCLYQTIALTIALTFFSTFNQLHSQNDTLHLNYHYSQNTAHDSTQKKIDNWIKSLNGKHVNIDIVAYYHKSEFKPAAVSRTEDLFIVINRKARNQVSIDKMEQKKGKDSQRSLVDIVYHYTDGTVIEKPAVAPPPAATQSSTDTQPVSKKPSTDIKEPSNVSKKQTSKDNDGLVNDSDEEKNPKAIVKLNLLQLPLLNISGQVEYAFHKNISGALGVSYLVKRDVPKLFFDTPDTSTAALGIAKPQFYAFSITPEVRFYPFKNDKGGAPHGFYVAPYFRYSKFSVSADFRDIVDLKPVDFNYTLTYAGGTGGLLIGAQWILGKHVSLDWWIIGGGFGRARVVLEAASSSVNMSSKDQQEVKDQLESDFSGVQFLGYSAPQVETTNNSVKMTIKGLPMTSFRGLGLCLGIAF